MKLSRLFITLLLFSLPAWSDPNDAVEAIADSLTANLPASLERCTVAVFPFTGAGEPEGQALSEMMVRELSTRPRFTVVDRDAFRKAMAEIALSQTGAFDETTALTAGKIMAARYLLTGTVADAFGLKRINVKLTNTETSELVATGAAVLSGTELSSLQKELLSEKASITGSLFRSLLLPGWGQIYTDHPVRGGISMAVCLSGLGITIASAIASSDARTNYDAWSDDNFFAEGINSGRFTESGYKTEKEKLYQTYSDKQDQLTLMITVTSCAWVLNLIDATLAGVHAKKRYTPYFTLANGCPGISIVRNFP